MKIIPIFILTGMMLLLGCVSEDDFVRIDNRLAQLEQQNEQYADITQTIQQQTQASQRATSQIAEQEKIYRQERQGEDRKLRTQAAELRGLIEELREEIQEMGGRLEETAFVWRQKTASMEEKNSHASNELRRLDTSINSIKARTSHIERYLNLESPETLTEKGGALVPKTAPKGVASLTENELYASAKQAFDQSDLKDAREKFASFIKTFPKSKQADNAQFWIGEIYYREKWYEKAILEYQKVIENYPRGNKVRASLLKQGLAFYKLGDKANARLILRELLKKYPKSNESKIAKKILKGA